MFKKPGLYLIVPVFIFSVNAYAGKTELTTYYPAPSGEYSELNASKSFIPPRMTTADRPTATSTPPAVPGMVIFNTDSDKNQLEVYNGSDWASAGGGSPVVVNGFLGATKNNSGAWTGNALSINGASATFSTPDTITVPANETYTLIASASSFYYSYNANDLWVKMIITVNGNASVVNLSSRKFAQATGDRLECSTSLVQALDGGSNGTSYTLNVMAYDECSLSRQQVRLSYTVLKNKL